MITPTKINIHGIGKPHYFIPFRFSWTGTEPPGADTDRFRAILVDAIEHFLDHIEYSVKKEREATLGQKTEGEWIFSPCNLGYRAPTPHYPLY